LGKVLILPLQQMMNQVEALPILGTLGMETQAVAQVFRIRMQLLAPMM